jgi:excisionase family DNA binding protein
MEPRPQGYTLKDAAKRIGVVTRTVRRWIEDGDLKATKIKGQRGWEWRVDAVQVDQLLLERVALVDEVTEGTSRLGRSASKVADLVRDAISDIIKIKLQNPLDSMSLNVTHIIKNITDSNDKISALIAGYDMLMRRQEAFNSEFLDHLATHERAIALETELVEERRKVTILQDRLRRARMEAEEYRRVWVIGRRPVPWEFRKKENEGG